MVKEVQEGLNKAVNAIKIAIVPQEKEKLTGELSIFLQWLEPLLAVETSSVDQALFCLGAVNVWREDRAQPGELNELQKTASNFDEGFYQVPTIIE